MQFNMYVLEALAQLIQSSTYAGTSTFSDQSSSLLWLANAERAKVGIPPLKINKALCELALMKSKDMSEKNYFSHNSPTFGSSFDMIKARGINYAYAGENLAIDKYAEHAHISWMNSEAHRKNILHPAFAEVGIGIYPKGNNSYVYTEMFVSAN